MRKYIFAALMALCIAVPGAATTSPVMSFEIVVSPEIAPQLVEAILQAVAEQTSWTFEELDQMYRDHSIVITKVEGGYSLSQADGGGMAIILLEDLI